ncbi:MAG: CrcB protein [Hyphomicrobiaceae bacterium]|jgi:CrcB protein
MRELLFVGVGGFFGACARYLATSAVLRVSAASPVPLATLSVNVVGCALIGVAVGLADGRGLLAGETRLLAVVGFLGGFTTYSSFGLEAFELLRRGAIATVAAYIGAHLLFGIGAVAAGYALGRSV